MIKELILSLALSAASSLPFLDSPKREFSSLTSCYGTYSAVVSNTSADVQYPDNSHLYGNPVYDTTIYVEDNNQHPNWAFRFFYDDYSAHLEVLIAFDNLSLADDALNLGYNPQGNGYYEDDNYTDEFDDLYWACFCYSWDDLDEGYLEFTLVGTSPSFTLTKTFTNCAGYVVGSGGVLSPLPSSYTQADLQNPYTCRFYASEGYYFDNRTVAANITQSGGIVITDVVFDTPLNNDRYTTGFSCSITLPLANCSLSAVANEHTYTITSELNRCSVSGLPLSYTNELEGTYVFIAAANNGFNRNAVSYEITGATYEVSYSGVLYGDFYQNLTISIEARFSDVSIRVTAVSYDPVPYQQGYQDGYQEGYAQGKIAGDSYGVWNWLKQAARTTGEFLNIPLLPGFSIGGLLTALAGLVIIWLFIKGFLFKS